MNKNSNSFEIIFDSKSENESFARVVVAAFCTRLDPTLEEISDIKNCCIGSGNKLYSPWI